MRTATPHGLVVREQLVGRPVRPSRLSSRPHGFVEALRAVVSALLSLRHAEERRRLRHRGVPLGERLEDRGESRRRPDDLYTDARVRLSSLYAILTVHVPSIALLLVLSLHTPPEVS